MHQHWEQIRLLRLIRAVGQTTGQSHSKSTLAEGDSAYQCLSREHLQQRDEVVSISEVLV